MARPLAGFAASPWYEAGGEIVWIGANLPALHPRAVITSIAPVRGRALGFDSIPRSAWSPRVARAPDSLSVEKGARRLRRALLASATPSGFGALLAGRKPAFPLHLAKVHIEALRQACERDDPVLARGPAGALIGLGAGLTPSGDDLVGGLLFAKRWLRPRDQRWLALGRRLISEARARSHSVSAALFSDLAAGRSFAPLHKLAAALGKGDDEHALSAARALVSIGHSSGWDMLAGFLLAAGALPVEPPAGHLS